VHPYMAQGVARERVADFIRTAEASRKAREGAQPRSRRPFGSRRRHPAGRQPIHAPARPVLAYSGPADFDNDRDRSAELCDAGR
jgi:hypothetical protein